jgi:hypothetical protein
MSPTDCRIRDFCGAGVDTSSAPGSPPDSAAAAMASVVSSVVSSMSGSIMRYDAGACARGTDTLVA